MAEQEQALVAGVAEEHQEPDGHGPAGEAERVGEVQHRRGHEGLAHPAIHASLRALMTGDTEHQRAWASIPVLYCTL